MGRSIQLQRASKLPYYTLADRQAKTGALAHLLGGKKRLEYGLSHSLGHTGTVIGHPQLHGVSIPSQGDRDTRRLNAFCNSVSGICQQVQYDLLQLDGVTHNVDAVTGNLKFNHYAGSNHLLTDQVEGVVDGLIQIHRRRCFLGIAAKPPELVDDVACLIKGSSCTLGPGQQKFPIHFLAAFEMTLDVVAGELDG